jgi:ribonuclease III
VTSLLEAVAALTGHAFADAALLRRALTHSTFAHEHPGEPDYERLEFLGDAVVQLCASELLFERHPDATEHTLTNLRQRIVRQPALADVGRAMGLARQARFGKGEAGKEVVEKIHCDLFEALVGAVYLDGGLEPCRALARRWLLPRIEALGEVVRPATTAHPKNRLQEFTEHADRRWGPPRYELVGTEGPDHDRVYQVACLVQGREIARGAGRNKTEAETNAADMALTILRRGEPEGRP